MSVDITDRRPLIESDDVHQTGGNKEAKPPRSSAERMIDDEEILDHFDEDAMGSGAEKAIECTKEQNSSHGTDVDSADSKPRSTRNTESDKSDAEADSQQNDVADVNSGDADKVAAEKDDSGNEVKRKHSVTEDRIVDQTLGPHEGTEGVSAERGDDASKEERALVNEVGDKYGCWTCSATESGHADGHWTPDHQPPNALAPEGPWTLYPQCKACARQQGGIVRSINGGWYNFD